MLYQRRKGQLFAANAAPHWTTNAVATDTDEVQESTLKNSGGGPWAE